MGESRVYVGVPDYSGMVEREDLVRVAGGSILGLVVIGAPAGFGKTVLASQIVAKTVGSTVWLQLNGAPIDQSRLFQMVCTRIQTWGGCPANSSGHSPRACRERVCLALAQSRPFTLVLDDVPADLPASELMSAITKLRSHGPSPETVIITTRRDSPEWIVELAPDLFFGAANLKLSDQQTARAMEMLSGQSVSSAQLARAVELSRGHAATIAVIARQMPVGPDSGRSTIDLNAHLRLLACAQLQPDELETLCALSMVAAGRMSSVGSILGRQVNSDAQHIASRIPLLQVPGPEGSSTFKIHDLASEVYSSPEFVAAVGLDYRHLLGRAIEVLAKESEYLRLFELVLIADDSLLATETLLRSGQQLLAIGALNLLASVLDLVPTRETLLSPRLLLLQAELLRERMQFEDAMSKAAVARDLAEIDEDAEVLAPALMLLARLQLDCGLISEAACSLERLLDAKTCPTQLALTGAAYLTLCRAFAGDHKGADQTRLWIKQTAAQVRVEPAVAVRIATSLATTRALVDGKWGDALLQLLSVRNLIGVPAGLAVQTEGNIGTALIETGRIERGVSALEDAVACSERYGLRMLELSFRDSLALAHAGRGEYAAARSVMEAAIAGCRELGDRLELARQYSYLAMIVRAYGDCDESLQFAEVAMEESANLQCPWSRWMASLEVAASLLSLGDVAAAMRQAQWVRSESAISQAGRYVLTADLILAAADAQRGEPQSGMERLGAHSDLLSDAHSAFLMAMYARSFPALLPIIACSSGGLPLSVMRLMDKGVLDSASRYCAMHSSEVAMLDVWSTLCRTDPPAAPHTCRVRLFGGLDVRVGERVVREHDWRKRKARVLFALMVLQGGRDLPREQICDLLWPELDAVKARNNFYVIWSIMKGALIPDAPRGTKLEYADNTGGLCRIDVELVSSDVEEFSRTLAAARGAENSGDSAEALSCYERLRDIYRGDLLPGDLYDDCFSAARDRYRVEFCEAMRRAVDCAARAERPDDCLLFARAGLDSDPLSEDLYRAVMRYHIDAGQRSAAIDAYFACRQRLCDDLGLDPSSETMKLYEMILCMDADEADSIDASDPFSED